MEPDEIDEGELFSSITASSARVLLIGRRALVALGAPVLTADYDPWIHIDDIEKLNGSLRQLDLIPNSSPEEARVAVGTSSKAARTSTSS